MLLSPLTRITGSLRFLPKSFCLWFCCGRRCLQQRCRRFWRFWFPEWSDLFSEEPTLACMSGKIQRENPLRQIAGQERRIAEAFEMKGRQQHDTIIAQTRLTSAMRCAIVEGMNRARLLRLLLGGGLTVPSLASGRQAFVPLDKPAGGGAFVSL